MLLQLRSCLEFHVCLLGVDQTLHRPGRSIYSIGVVVEGVPQFILQVHQLALFLGGPFRLADEFDVSVDHLVGAFGAQCLGEEELLEGLFRSIQSIGVLGESPLEFARELEKFLLLAHCPFRLLDELLVAIEQLVRCQGLGSDILSSLLDGRCEQSETAHARQQGKPSDEDAQGIRQGG